jgi:uncharacterized membrane protein
LILVISAATTTTKILTKILTILILTTILTTILTIILTIILIKLTTSAGNHQNHQNTNYYVKGMTKENIKKKKGTKHIDC